MHRLASFMSFFAAIFLLAACATVNTGQPRVKIDEVLAGSDVMRFPYEKTVDGHLLIPVSLNSRDPGYFAIDTGATRSVIFKDTSLSLKLTEQDFTDIRVHGLVEANNRPMVKLARLEIGHSQFFDINLAVLDNRSRFDKAGEPIEGLIGLDILSRFRLYLDADNQLLYFIPGTAPDIRKPKKWKHIPLLDNPYANDSYDLKFFMADFEGRVSPVLLDSGSSVNFLNWEIATHPKVRRLRKRLQKQWSIEGATGTFEPKIHVSVEGFYSGEKYWHRQSFIVTDLSSLDVLGISGKPFAIAGVGMLTEDSFYLDFSNNRLFVRDRS